MDRLVVALLEPPEDLQIPASPLHGVRAAKRESQRLLLCGRAGTGCRAWQNAGTARLRPAPHASVALSARAPSCKGPGRRLTRLSMRLRAAALDCGSQSSSWSISSTMPSFHLEGGAADRPGRAAANGEYGRRRGGALQVEGGARHGCQKGNGKPAVPGEEVLLGNVGTRYIAIRCTPCERGCALCLCVRASSCNKMPALFIKAGTRVDGTHRENQSIFKLPYRRS